jgi:hypothetical protein
MSNAIHHAPVCHAVAEGSCHHATCGAWSDACSTDRTAVTCKRCLASLAKRDREFQRKARNELVAHWFTQPHNVYRDAEAARDDADRAIAREEGRS